MTNEQREKGFVDGVRKVLAETEAQTDTAIRMRLRSARLAALEAVEQKAPWYTRFPQWAAAGGLATVAVLVTSLSLWFAVERRDLPVAQVEDLEILTNNEQLDMYKDLDFYRWLENADHAG